MRAWSNGMRYVDGVVGPQDVVVRVVGGGGPGGGGGVLPAPAGPVNSPVVILFQTAKIRF